MMLQPIHWPLARLRAAAALLMFAAVTASAQRVNLAKFQSVTADSNASSAIWAVDGVVDNGSRWISSGAGPHWLEVSFPVALDIGSAQVFSGTNDTQALASFSLQYFNGVGWTTFPGASVSGNTNTERNVIFTTSATASRVRLYTTDATAAVKELALYPTNVGGFALGTDVRLNLAEQQFANVSSWNGTNYPKKAVDGYVDNTSVWSSTNGPGPHTLEIALFSPTLVGSAHLYCGLTGQPATVITNFSLQYYDGTNWLDFAGGVITNNTALERRIDFTTPASTTQVRLLVPNAGTVRVRELALFAANGGVGYALGTDVSITPPLAQKAEDYSDSFYKLVHRGDGLALDGGTNASLLAATGTSFGQQYQVLLNVGTGTYRIRSRTNGLCLEPLAAAKTNGTPIVEAVYTGLPHQLWKLAPVTGGYVQITNVWSGLAIDVAATPAVVGTAIVQNAPTTSTNQHWTLTYVTFFPKKGLAGWTDRVPDFNVSWYYNWGMSRPAGLAPEVNFLPMQWANFSASALPKNFPGWWGDGDPMLFLGFNEPDHTDQANMTVDTALDRWPLLEAANVPQVSPAPASAEGTWMVDFMTRADALGLRNDYVALHWYANPSADGLINSLTSAHNRYGRPILLTEFNCVDWGGTATWTEEQVYSFFAEVLWRFEGLSWFKRYSLFPFNPAPRPPSPQDPSGPTGTAFGPDGELTPIGELYAAWDGDTTVRTNTNYFVHNKSTHDRLLNPLSGSTPGSADINSRGGSAQWQLLAAPMSGRFYLSAARDARRLAWSGSALSVVTNNTTGTNVEWRLTSYANGWFYVEHVATGSRLSLSGSTLSMASSSTATDAVRWRFIKPLYADGPNMPPTLSAVSNFTLSPNLTLTVPFTASDLDAPPQTFTFSLDTAPAGARINAATGLFTWRPTTAQTGTTNTVAVVVTDNGVPSLSTTQFFTITVLATNRPTTLTLQSGNLLLNGVPMDSTYASPCIHILSSDPTSSDTGTLISGNQWSSTGAMIHRSLLSFDLAPLISLAGRSPITISSARIVLQSFAVNGSGMTHELRLTDAFNSGANWNTSDGTTAWPVAGGTLGSVLGTVGSSTGTKTWGPSAGILNAVNAALTNANHALSLMLRGAWESNQDMRNQFRSATYTTTLSERPMLVLDFTVGTPQAENLTWRGNLSPNWDLDLAENWLNALPAPDYFLSGDTVTFDNSSAVTNVTLATALVPASVSVNSTQTYTFSGAGALSGSAALTKAGSGVLNLNTTNDYTGGTFVNAGSLVLGNSSALGATNSSTTIADGAQVRWGNGTWTFNEPFILNGPSGSQTLRGTGSSTATLNGRVTLASSATIKMDGSAAFTLNSDVTSTNASLTVMLDGSTASVINGAISLGAGGLIKSSTSTLRLNHPANTWTGGTTISGTLQIGAGGGGAMGTGTVTNNGVLVWNTTNAITLADAILGTGRIQQSGPGLVTLGGNNTFSGTTTVSGGALLVNGSLGTNTVTVSGGRFGGSGTVNGTVTVQSGATLAPGSAASLGTLILSNGLALAGKLEFRLNKSFVQSNDFVAVTGALTNAGSGPLTLTNLGPALVAGDTFKLFNRPLTNGAALTLVSAGGVLWTNRLALDGTVRVLSAPAITSPNFPPGAVTILPDGSISLTATGAVGANYRLWVGTNLALMPITNTWTLLQTGAVSFTPFTVTDPAATNYPQRFYRFSAP